MKQYNEELSRRMMTENGWVYFCRLCGTYQPETQFYDKPGTTFNKDSRCKIHYLSKGKDDSPEMKYLELSPIKQHDFTGAQRILENLGYEFGEGKPSVNSQFLERHKNKLNRKK